MTTSQPTSASTPAATPEPTAAAPAIEAPSAEVLITEQEVLFGTAAAVPARRATSIGRSVASITRMFAASARTPRPQRRDYPRRYEFLERALLGREMDRL